MAIASPIQQAPAQRPLPGVKPRKLAIAIQIFAVVIILIWLYVLYWLGSSQITQDELHWTRLTYLFNSLEAVAFAAAGALFGTQVQRTRVEKAEQTAEKGVNLASKVKESALDMRTILQLPGLNVDRQRETAEVHSEIDRLADDILRDARN
jgi:hypothetical protein